MRYLKQSTSVDLGIGPFLDSTDGVTPETGLSITQPDVRLKKNGGNWAQKNASQTLSHEENGWYEVNLDATDTATLGVLLLNVSKSGALPVWFEFMVLPANAYDTFVLGTDRFDVDVLAMAADVVTSSALASSAVTEIQTGLATASSIAALNDLSATEVEDAVWDAAIASHLDSGSTGAALNAAGSSGDPWSTALPGAYTAGTAGHILGTNLNATVSSRASQTSVDTIDGIVDSILDDTGTQIPNQITALNDISASDVWAVTVRTLSAGTNIVLAKGTGITGFNDLSATQVEDAVWDADTADHQDSGSTGEALSAAGSGGDPWATSLPGSYTAGQAGYIIGNNINATISSRASQTSVDTVDGIVDAILVDTGTTIPAQISGLNDISASDVWAAGTRELTSGDNIVLAKGTGVTGFNDPTATENADALLNRDMSAVSDTNSRSPLNALRILRNKVSTTSGNLVVTKENDTTTAWTGTLTSDPSASPITGVDPA